MKQIHLSRKPIDKKVFAARKTLAREQDCANVIAESCVVHENGKPALVYLSSVEEGSDRLLHALRNIPYHKTARSAGLTTNSRTIGGLPRLAFKRDYCTVSALHRECPNEYAQIMEYAGISARYFQIHAPKVYEAQHQQVASAVLAQWVLPGGVYTSGICNKDNQLAYHYDHGNFTNSWSSMWYFQRDTAGGFLACPEYDTMFKLHSGSLIMFEGAKLLHGVTPIKKLSSMAYRHTLVFYPMKGMAHCGTADEEAARIRVVKTQREARRSFNGGKL